MTIKNNVVGYKVDWNNERHKKLMQVICLESAMKIHKKNDRLLGNFNCCSSDFTLNFNYDFAWYKSLITIKQKAITTKYSKWN